MTLLLQTTEDKNQFHWCINCETKKEQYIFLCLKLQFINNYWIRFFCDNQNIQLGEVKLKPKADADNTWWDLDYTRCHKNQIQ